MFEIKSIELKKELNVSNIENELKEKGYNGYDLAKCYIKGFKEFDISIKSDLRTNDKNNSMIASIRNGKLIVSDFGFKVGMDIYQYLLEKEFSGNRRNFPKVLETIRRDFKLNNIENLDIPVKISNTPKKHNKLIAESSLPVKIEVKRERLNGKIKWSKQDELYWGQYGITVEYLEKKRISPINAFWVTNFSKGGVRTKYDVSNELAYVYPFFRNIQGMFMYKIYLPNGFKGNKDFKWISNVNKKVIQNINNIPKSGELLIIQSSYKDSILMELLNEDLNVIAPNGEGIWFDDIVWNDLRKNWKHIVLFADNDFNKGDNPGLAFARKHSEKYNIPFISTPDNTASDISDFRKLYGEKKTRIFLDNCLTNIKLLI